MQKMAPLGILLALVFASSDVLCFDLEQLSDDCLKSRSFSQHKDVDCLTAKGLQILKLKENSKSFYCVNYEKQSGNINEFDVVKFDLSNDDYELKFIGTNILETDPLSPKFKMFDTRMRRTYKGRFAFASQNSQFDIFRIKINNEDQTCNGNGKLQTWPIPVPTFDIRDKNGVSTIRPTTTYQEEPRLGDECGVVKKIGSSSSSYAGQYPWTVSIYRYFRTQMPIYKCAGTIVDRKTILTSVNCLLEDGLLLNPADLRVYVSPFDLSENMQSSKTFNIAGIKTHEEFNFYLENNIAVLKLSGEVSFNDFVQPICLPNYRFSPSGKTGKLAGFGKPSSLSQPKTNVLTAAEFFGVDNGEGRIFNAELKSGDKVISDMGAGLYVNDGHNWLLSGIMSKKVHSEADDTTNNLYSFTNVAKYSFWIDQARKS